MNIVVFGPNLKSRKEIKIQRIVWNKNSTWVVTFDIIFTIWKLSKAKKKEKKERERKWRSFHNYIIWTFKKAKREEKPNDNMRIGWVWYDTTWVGPVG